MPTDAISYRLIGTLSTELVFIAQQYWMSLEFTLLVLSSKPYKKHNYLESNL